MLRVIEFGLLGVSLLVVVGLIVTGRRDSPGPSGPEPEPTQAEDHGKLPE